MGHSGLRHLLWLAYCNTIMTAVAASVEDGRRAALAMNEAALLRDVLIREIRALGALYCVGKRRPISELTPEHQQLVRQAYQETGWASDYGVEVCGVYTSLPLAEQACKERGANYFYTKLPIDSCLPDEVVFGEWAHVFPGSDALDMYENLTSATIAVRVAQMRAIEDELRNLREQIEAVNAAKPQT